MGNWTPGPWRIYTPDDYEGPDSLPGLGIESESGEAVVWYAELPDQGLANDRDTSLIAAAPELFAEVEREYIELANPRNDWDGRHTPEGQKKLCRLRDLIAKATGRDSEDVQDDYGNRHLTE